LTDEVIFEERGAVAHVRLERPERRNALTRAMLERLGEIFASVASRTDLRAVILSGSGPDFCAGADIAELGASDEATASEKATRGQEVCERIELCGTPVIAAVQGAAAGGGCELALACHLRVASSNARLEEVSAEEAFRLGLVNRVVEPDRLFAEAEALAQSIIDNAAPLAARACLQAVTRGARLPLDEALRLEAELFASLFATADVREGTRAFLEKRKPSFRGK
jgi:enoyl-CoA hydratase